MRHYVGYHKPQRMGYALNEITSMGLYTNKSVNDEMCGNVVWLITGDEAKPKNYFLYFWFVVDLVEPSANRDDFGATLYGSQQHGEFPNPIALNGYDWFGAFRTGMGNFGLGLQPITNGKHVTNSDEIIETFVRLASENGCPLPTGSS